MAVRTSLTWIKRRFAQALRGLAGREAWSRDRYEFTGTYSERTGRFTLIFGTTNADVEDYFPKIMEALRQAFLDYPEIVSRVSLVIRKVEDTEEVYRQLLIDEDEVDLGDLLA